jgi:acyl-CoA synthetase (AMP-forming)/AMP-acid ligase II
VSFTIAVSNQLKQILTTATLEQYSLSTLRCVVSSSSVLPIETKNALMGLLQCELHECYGTSEIAIATNIKLGQIAKNTSVGFPIPDVEVVILDEQMNQCALEQAGEIACRTPMAFTGYYKQPSLTSLSFQNGFFLTGDIGKKSADGSIQYLGRKKDLIITGGINVYPSDIEDVITRFSSVDECAAFPVADEVLGEVVAVGLVVRERQSFNAKKLSIELLHLLSAYQIPRKYYFLENLPKTPLGKIEKYKLKALTLDIEQNKPEDVISINFRLPNNEY